MHRHIRAFAFVVSAIALVAVGAAASLAGDSPNKTGASTPKRGGSITIARIEDSQSFDKTNVFQNESIWITEQINEPLYLAANDGKTLRP